MRNAQGTVKHLYPDMLHVAMYYMASTGMDGWMDGTVRHPAVLDRWAAEGALKCSRQETPRYDAGLVWRRRTAARMLRHANAANGANGLEPQPTPDTTRRPVTRVPAWAALA